MAIEAQYRDIQSLLGESAQFYMPEFQRLYAWEDEHWNAFWEDVARVTRPNADPTQIHFIASIVVSIREEVQRVAEGYEIRRTFYDVLDGQQRLITTSLLLAALRMVAISNLLDGQLEQEVRPMLFRLPGELTMVEEIERCRVRPKAEDLPAFLHALALPGYGRVLGSRVTGAFEFFISKVGELFPRRDTQSDTESNRFRFWCTQLKQRFGFVLIKHDDRRLRFDVFRDLNTRGKDLSQVDLIRSLIYMRTEGAPPPAADVRASFGAIETVINSDGRQGTEEAQELLTSVFYKRALVWKGDSFDAGLLATEFEHQTDEVARSLGGDRQQMPALWKLIGDVATAAKPYVALSLPEQPVMDRGGEPISLTNPDLFPDLEFLMVDSRETRRNGLTRMADPLLLEILRNVRLGDPAVEQTTAELFNMVAAWFMRRRIAFGPSTDKRNRPFINVAHAIRNPAEAMEGPYDLDSLDAALRRMGGDDRWPGDEEFAQLLLRVDAPACNKSFSEKVLKDLEARTQNVGNLRGQPQAYRLPAVIENQEGAGIIRWVLLERAILTALPANPGVDEILACVARSQYRTTRLAVNGEDPAGPWADLTAFLNDRADFLAQRVAALWPM